MPTRAKKEDEKLIDRVLNSFDEAESASKEVASTLNNCPLLP
jgi:hypothetical protein